MNLHEVTKLLTYASKPTTSDQEILKAFKKATKIIKDSKSSFSELFDQPLYPQKYYSESYNGHNLIFMIDRCLKHLSFPEKDYVKSIERNLNDSGEITEDQAEGLYQFFIRS